jgi:hypothetical protein
MGSWSAVMEVMRKAAGDRKTHTRMHIQAKFPSSIMNLHVLSHNLLILNTLMVSFLATMSDFCNSINKDLELSLYNSHKIPVHTYIQLSLQYVP